MVKIVETLIFDFDGTLVDSRQDIINALNYTLRKLDYPPLPAEVVAGYVGGGAAALVQEALGVNSRELNERFLPVFSKYMLDIALSILHCILMSEKCWHIIRPKSCV
jgi:phosphoglycolate phosphatase-like HAD superfamily hydrolase